MNATLPRLLGLAAMPVRRLGAAVALGALALCCAIGLAASAGYLISRAAEHPPILSLTVAIVAVRFFGLARPIARYLDRLFSHDLALRALGRIRARFYAEIEPLAPGELDGFRRGDLVSRMVGDVDALQGLYLRGIGPPLVAVVGTGAAVLAAALLLPLAGLVLAAGLLLAGTVVPAAAAAFSRAATQRQAATRGELTARLVELLRGAPELVVYGRAVDELGEVRALDRKLTTIARRDTLAAGLSEGATILVTGLTVVGVLAVAVSAHSAGTLDRVFVVTLALLALASFEGVAPLAGAARELRAALVSGGRVLELIDRKPAVRDPEVPLGPPPARPTIALESVTARYPDASSPVLEGFDLVLEPGARIALVGPSGAGKTTVTNLLLRFLDPVRGRVTIAGRDARDYRQADVRAVFALAGQEAHIFNSTVRENLRLARPEATDAQLERALSQAQLLEWVDGLAAGLDTPVGEAGGRLSGGQRQRLLLARALLVDAPVLILDEPTAHLDAATATALLEDIVAAAGARSILLITHRPEGLDLMDRVVRLAG
ncbi:MAG TPA: thiol reductant ABC exporter subunit CydC [Gaiellaceae bacterium]|jgi:thiol reductant ABC exporter CydC subunit|nr:thiol reductant ABC exporter subunit CydC [Gaiellaceae bacterium]